MNTTTIQLLRRLFCMLLLLTITKLAWAQETSIGFIKVLEGHATVTHGQLTYVASLGGAIYQNDTLHTAWDGELGITFKDNTRIALGPSSRLTIPAFVFEPANKRYGFILQLVDGTLQYLSGLTAKLSPDSMKIELPTATIAVHGTRFLARTDP